jgi:ribosomal protein L37E
MAGLFVPSRASALVLMNCNVCGHGWHASETYCPRCGFHVLPNRKRFYWEIFWMILAAAFVWLLTGKPK